MTPSDVLSTDTVLSAARAWVEVRTEDPQTVGVEINKSGVAVVTALSDTIAALRRENEELREDVAECAGFDSWAEYREYMDSLAPTPEPDGTRRVAIQDLAVEQAPRVPCDCWREAVNRWRHHRDWRSACTCGDHPTSEQCDCPFCAVSLQSPNPY